MKVCSVGNENTSDLFSGISVEFPIKIRTFVALFITQFYYCHIYGKYKSRRKIVKYSGKSKDRKSVNPVYQSALDQQEKALDEMNGTDSHWNFHGNICALSFGAFYLQAIVFTIGEL